MQEILFQIFKNQALKLLTKKSHMFSASFHLYIFLITGYYKRDAIAAKPIRLTVKAADSSKDEG
jgi:hypothetical protein